MEVLAYKPANIANRELVMEGEDMRVQVLTLGENDCIPWHYHSEIKDAFVCLEGTLVVETKAPKNTFIQKWENAVKWRQWSRIMFMALICIQLNL